MTDKELKKEAEEYVSTTASGTAEEMEMYEHFYLAGVEPREKQLKEKDKKIADLEAQIEKMKNWCNCKNYQQCLIELAEQGKGMKPSECCVNCKKWEIKENG